MLSRLSLFWIWFNWKYHCAPNVSLANLAGQGKGQTELLDGPLRPPPNKPNSTDVRSDHPGNIESLDRLNSGPISIIGLDHSGSVETSLDQSQGRVPGLGPALDADLPSLSVCLSASLSLSLSLSLSPPLSLHLSLPLTAP